MEIVVSYAKAYLKIMNSQPWAITIYFDGFAGSGLIEVEDKNELIKGTSLRILEIKDPKPFDLYYFVEKDLKTKLALETNINKNNFSINAKVVKDDCNTRLKSMSEFLFKCLVLKKVYTF